MMTIEDVRTWVWTEATKAERLSLYDRCRNPSRFYLYYRRGALALAAEQPIGFELGTPEAVPMFANSPGVVAWIADHAARLPCLPQDA